MSDRDVLKRAAEALKQSSEPTKDELSRLRERVLQGNAMSTGSITPLRSRSRARTLRWVLPMAAALVAGTALAATPGALDGMLDAAERFMKLEWLAPAQEAKLDRKAAKRARSQPPKEPTSAVAPAEQPAATPVLPAPAPAPELAADGESVEVASAQPSSPSPRASAKRTRAAPATSQAPDVAASPSRDLTVYRRAHDLHFRQRDYASALVHWDDYLRELPSGTFAVEARYNRALCLLHLARYEEAKQALRPFALGDGTRGFRRAEAQRLLEALDHRP